MATLETQYSNYLKDNPDSTFTFDQWKEWHGNNIRQALIQIMKDDEELGLYDETSKCACGQNPSCECEPKQETLEEAIKRLCVFKVSKVNDEMRSVNFEIGAKWQMERSYSEEEVNNIFYAICKHSFFEDNVETVYIQDVKDEFEQFKKK